jgi:uncharacterized protein related to proFAR isomerase
MVINQSELLEVPAVSIYNGTIVVAQGEQYETLTIDHKVPDTLDLLEVITENYETIYVTDINGLLEGKPQINIVKKMNDFCEVWLDAGVSEAENIYDLLVAGVQEVIISSKTLESLLELARAHELSENIIFELDYDNGILSPNLQISDMSPDKLGSEIKDIGLDRLIFADIARIQTNKSLESDSIIALSQLGFKLYVGGGIKLRDISMLNKLNVSGAIIELVNILQYGRVEF